MKILFLLSLVFSVVLSPSVKGWPFSLNGIPQMFQIIDMKSGIFCLSYGKQHVHHTQVVENK
jgi:hypothetical protein